MPKVDIQVEVDVTPFYVSDPTEESAIQVSTNLTFMAGQADPAAVRRELRRLADNAADQYAASVGGRGQAGTEREGDDAGSGA